MFIKVLKRIISKIIPILLLSLCVLDAKSFTSKDDSLHFEILLSSKMLIEIQLNENFINSIDITSDRLILLSSSNQFYLLGWGGINPIGQKLVGNIGSFSFTPENLLMTIRNNELCITDSLGNLNKLFALPSEGMGIIAGKYVMYVYDRNIDKKKYALYLLARGGKYKKLFEILTPIKSVVENDNSILFSTENAVFSFNLKNKQLKALAALPKNKEIKSIAVDTLNNRIYFSTDNMVYALKDSSVVIITNEFGGVLRFFNRGLIVFNPEKKFLVRISGIEDNIASKMQELKNTQPEKSPDNILTNTTIIDLVKSNLSDGLIINLINRSVVDFNLSVDSMIYLSSQNVSSAVIMAMKNVMKRKISNVSNDGNH